MKKTNTLIILSIIALIFCGVLGLLEIVKSETCESPVPEFVWGNIVIDTDPPDQILISGSDFGFKVQRSTGGCTPPVYGEFPLHQTEKIDGLYYESHYLLDGVYQRGLEGTEVFSTSLCRPEDSACGYWCCQNTYNIDFTIPKAGISCGDHDIQIFVGGPKADGNGNWEETKTFNFNPCDPICTISANPNPIAASGDPTTLTWLSENATSCNPTWTTENRPISWTEVVYPSTATTYGLDCYNALSNKSYYCATTVTIGGSPSPTLSCTLEADPSGGIPPLNGVDLKTTVGGTATGNINYYLDCTNNGTWENTLIGTSTNPYTKFDLCNYTSAGTYTAKARVERNGLWAECTTDITVTDNPPVGYHDAWSGIQPQQFCRASGWATDPDDRNIDLNLRIYSNGVHVGQGVANAYRADLEGQCPGGTCAFNIGLYLNTNIAHNIDNSITVKAQDIPSGLWHSLSGTPKILNCYDVPTCSISATPSSGYQGTTSTLNWSSSGATSCTGSGDWSGAKAINGSESVTPPHIPATYTYNLSCTGPGGTGTCSTTLAISNRVPTCALNAPLHNVWLNSNPTFSATGTDPDGDQYNAYFEITGYGSNWGSLSNSYQPSTWGPLNLGTCFSNWWRCFARDVHGGDSAWTGYWLVKKDTVPPTTTISYPAGTISPPREITITQTEDDICSGIASGTTYYRSWDIGTAEPITWAPYTTGTNDFTFTGVANKCYRWEYMATDNAGNDSAWAVGPAVCFPFVSCDIKANGSDGPLSVYYGASANLTWSSSDAVSCAASGDWSEAKAISGSESTGVLTALSQTYTITCNSAGGRGAAICNDSVTVTIPPPPTNPIGSCPNPGNSATISWTPAPGYTHHYVRVYNTFVGPPPVFYNDDYIGSSYTFVSTPGATYDWWVHTKDASDNWSASVGTRFTCGTPVPTVDIKARTAGLGSYSDGPLNINYNTAIDIQWTSTDATSCTASNAWSGAKPTSGTETTGNITSNQTYTITCTGPGGSFSDSIQINIGTLLVTLTANKTSGDAPLTGVILTATVSGTTTGTINYTFYCNRADDGTNITLPASHKLDNTNTNPYSSPPTACDSIYATPGTYRAKVIVERGNSAAQSQLTITVNVPPNQAPTATNPLRTNSSFCAIAPSYIFSWIYSDLDSDTESRFEFQVDNNSNFLSPEVNRSIINLSNPSPTTNTQAVVLATNQGLDNITYNTTYYWRARVYDEHGLVSGWLNGPSFLTPVHHYPNVDFTWTPNVPNVNESISLIDASTCYDESTSGSDCSTTKGDVYLWTMTGGIPDSSTTENTTTKYPSPPGLRNVILQVTDSSGFTCPKTKTININYPLPVWREVRPF